MYEEFNYRVMIIKTSNDEIIERKMKGITEKRYYELRNLEFYD